MSNQTEPASHFQATEPNAFDREYIVAHGFPSTRETTVTVPTVASGVRQYTVQTFRIPELGDSVFVTIAGPDGLQRVHLPPRVAAAIAAQREALTAKSRSRAAKAAAKRNGVRPGLFTPEARAKALETRRAKAAARAARRARRATQ